MRQSWSDDRLDHLNDKVDEGFALVDQRFEQVDARFDRIEEEGKLFRAEVAQRIDRLDEKFDGKFERLGARIDRFDRLQQNLILLAASLFGTVILAFSGLIATQI